MSQVRHTSKAIRFLLICWLLCFSGYGAAAVFADASAEAGTRQLPAETCGDSPVFHVGLEAAYAAAEKDQSLVLAVFRSYGCVFSRAFSSNTLQSDLFLNSDLRVHAVLLDVDENKALTEEFAPQFLPESFLLTPDGKIVDRRRGLIDPEELLAWIVEAEARAQRGEWIGFTTSGDFGAFLNIFENGLPTDTDYRKLVGMLGAKNAADRTAARKLIRSRLKLVMPYLVEAANSPYLGLRVGIREVLQKAAPDAPQVDPWAAEAERRVSAEKLNRWWSKTGRQGLEIAEGQAPPLLTLQRALEDILTDEAAARTRAMTMLVEMGEAVLPAIENKIAGKRLAGDQKAVRALEQVRWSILVTPDVERKIPDLKRVLATGTSRERMAVIEKLGGMGEAAIAVLSELVRQSDPLIQESAVYALARIENADVVPDIAQLLESPNANLRMTAAQLLGKSDRQTAADYLLPALSDPEEVVVLTALAALAELKAEEIGDPLISCLEDDRWRVRAKAAEVIGEMAVISAQPQLSGLLNDPDPFVIKSALAAFSEMEMVPAPEKTAAVAALHPDLVDAVVSLVVANPSEGHIKALGDLFEAMDAGHRARLLETLSHRRDGFGKKHRSAWREVFSVYLASADAGLREAAVSALSRCCLEVAAEFVPQLLKDPAVSVRRAAWDMVLLLVCYHWGYEGYASGQDQGILDFHEKRSPDAVDDAEATEKRGRAETLRDAHAAWHRMLVSDTGGQGHLAKIMAAYLTQTPDDSPEGWKPLAEAFSSDALQRLLEQEHGQFSLTLLISRMPWPASQAVIEALAAVPYAYSVLLSSVNRAHPELIGYLMSDGRVVENLEKGGEAEREMLAAALLAPADRQSVSLLKPDPRSSRLMMKLVESADPFLRTIGITVGGEDRTLPQKRLVALLGDPDHWVRRAAVMAIGKRIEVLADRESILGPMIRDIAPEVVKAALYSLLSQSIREKSGFTGSAPRFRYGNIELAEQRSVRYYGRSVGRPVVVINRKPSFLGPLKSLFASAADEAVQETKQMSVLLCAQYGEFGALTAEVEKWRSREPITDPSAALLTGIALSRDPAYLPALRQYAELETGENNLREVLNAIRRMRGDEARALRRTLNRRIRQYGN